MIQVYIGLGSNLDNPSHQLDLAQNALRALSSGCFQVSSYYSSKPQGPTDQPDFVNAVVGFCTHLDALDLLAALQAIEQAQGKVKLRHWGERVIDLDLLLYGEQVIDLPSLQVPHPQLQHRDFVLVPLLEIAPNLSAPGLGLLSNRLTLLGQSFLYSLH